MVDRTEFERWRGDADRALDAARVQARAALHNWACFAADQAVHLALKAFLNGLGKGPWGHDLVVSGGGVAEVVADAWTGEMEERLRRLSRHYIPARYPDAYASGTAASHYGESDARQAVEDAEAALRVIDFGPGSWRKRMARERSWARRAVDERRAARRALIERAGRYPSLLPPELDVVAVVVYGSVARGDFNAWSDVDVLVIASNLPERLQDRLALLIPFAPPGVQPLGWTIDEFSLQLARGNAIAREALERGVVVSGEERFRTLARSTRA